MQAQGQTNTDKPKTISERLADLERKVNVLEFQSQVLQDRKRPVYAILDCDSKRFGMVETDDPSRFLVLVSCANVEPYLEGYRVSLDIGNPYNVRLSGVRASLLYGTGFPLKKAEIQLVSGLNAGQWTRAVVNISQAQAAEMRNLRAEFYVEQIALSRPY